MGEENIFEATADNSDAGKSSESPVIAESPESGNGGAANGSGEESKANTDHRSRGNSNPEYTKAFKDRVDRIRSNERRRFNEELKKRDEAWEKKFKELEERFGAGAKPKTLKREDFTSDEEFAKAKRDAAIDEIMNCIDERNNAKSKQEGEARQKQEALEESQRKFAQKFQEGMRRTLSPEQQQEIITVVNDENSAVNTFLSGTAGSTLQNWLFEDCSIPADVLLYLEKNSDKLEILGSLSPRKQLEQLDILERYLAKAGEQARKKSQETNKGADENLESNGGRKPPVMGRFGGSSSAFVDESKLPAWERVKRQMLAMRRR